MLGIIGFFRTLKKRDYCSFNFNTDNELPFWKTLLLRTYYNLKGIGVSDDVNYGLDRSNVIIEQYPLVFKDRPPLKLQRI